MDISKWPMNQIMQLPDHCFGQRWLIGTSEVVDTGLAIYLLVPQALPDRCVIWSYSCWYGQDDFQMGGHQLKLGDVPNPAPAVFNAWDNVFTCLNGNEVPTGRIWIPSNMILTFERIRQPIEPQGRRFAAHFDNPSATIGTLGFNVVISSIPKEVPDCLLSV